MSIKFTKTTDAIWAYLTKNGMTKAGAAGMMGNMYAESLCNPVCMENLLIKRYKEWAGKTYTSETYMIDVDSGKISRAEFLNPFPNKVYAWGLAQWTSPGRKAGLYDLCKSKKKSIGDLDTQLEWLFTELKQSYRGVYKILTSTNDILSASNYVLQQFECPADTGVSVRETRYGYSKEVYDKYVLSPDEGKADKQATVSTKSQAIQTVIDIATAEIGYLEKKSNASLDSKTANAGSGNYTKYWRDVYPSFQGQPWCACFVSWCFMKAFGLAAAKKLLGHWPYTYCPTLAGMTTNKTPKKGSVIIFYRNGVYAHTGIVTEVSENKITTIEGNTSGASGIIPNGGGVCRKVYDKSTLSSNTKYYMPDYSIVVGKTEASGNQTSAGNTKPTDSQKENAAKPGANDQKDNVAKPDTNNQKDSSSSSGKLNETPKWTGMVTASSLNVRIWAGTEYPKIKSYPSLPYGTKVGVCDTVTDMSAEPWYFVKINNSVYGFVCGKYIKKV